MVQVKYVTCEVKDLFFFFKQKTAYEMRISDWSSDVCSSDLTWPTEDGHAWLVATAKSSHSLVVVDADTGERLRSVGGKGDRPGEFLRPNGIAIYGNHVFVAERDNHRVQVLLLPDFTPLGTFGTDQLRSPYGLWIHESAPGEYEVYVTDSFMEGAKTGVVPRLDRLDRRARRNRSEEHTSEVQSLMRNS